MLVPAKISHIKVHTAVFIAQKYLMVFPTITIQCILIPIDLYQQAQGMGKKQEKEIFYFIIMHYH